MKTAVTRLAAVSTLLTFGTSPALAHELYNDGAGTAHWLEHVAAGEGQPSGSELAPFGYAGTAPAAREIAIDKATRSINVTRLETVALRLGNGSTTWTFDTLGTNSFPLSKILPGADAVTVYVAESPYYQR